MSVGISPNQRYCHIYVGGGSGSGKTTFLLNLIRQDIQKGWGLTFIDPHHDPSLKLLSGYVPHSTDLLYFEPTEYPIGLNPLKTTSDPERDTVIGDLILIFKRLSQDSWGPRMDAILRWAFALLIRVPGATLLDLYRLLRQEDYRQWAVQQVSDPLIRDFWEREKLSPDKIEPIMSRLAPLLTSATMQNVFGHKSSINFFELLSSKAVLLVDLGLCSQDMKLFLGTVIMSMIQNATMRRAKIPEALRVPHFLFADEFQNFRTAAFKELLSEGRKFKLGMVLSNQVWNDVDRDLQHSIDGNIGRTGIKLDIGPDHTATGTVEGRELYSPLNLDPLPPPPYSPYIPRKFPVDGDLLPVSTGAVNLSQAEPSEPPD